MRALMVFSLGYGMNEVGMAGMPDGRAGLLVVKRGSMYVHPCRSLVHNYYFFLLKVPGTPNYYYFLVKSNKKLRKVTF